MISRRTALAYLAASPGLFKLAFAQRSSGKVALYTSVGSEIVHYDVDVPNAALIKRGSVTLPACVQYAWPHANRGYLYVACSDYFQDRNTTNHYVSALRVDRLTGELSKHGESVRLPKRNIHITTDIPSENILITFNEPSDVKVFRVNKDFTIGGETPQPGFTDKGFYAHSMRVTPDNRHAILVTRGSDATKTKPEDPGALKMFDYDRGVLSNEASIAPNGGIGFGPRNLDFHPTKPWAYVSLERENKLCMFRLQDGRLIPEVAYSKETSSAEPNKRGPVQMAGTIRVHPSGRFVYVTNRAFGTVPFDDQKVFAGGENSIAVFSIDQSSGEPTLIQSADQRRFYPRTVDLDPSGRLMAVQSTVPMKIREGNDVRVVPAGLTLSRVGADGKLKLERTYDNADYTQDNALWMGVLGL